jgi:hypothetical protein
MVNQTTQDITISNILSVIIINLILWFIVFIVIGFVGIFLNLSFEWVIVTSGVINWFVMWSLGAFNDKTSITHNSTFDLTLTIVITTVFVCVYYLAAH